MRDADLPAGPVREPVAIGDRTYELRGSESRILMTVAVFRSVAAHDLESVRSAAPEARGDLRHLSELGLIQRTEALINGERTSVVTLTKAGLALVESCRAPGRADRQTLVGGLVKPRELAHDAQLYRLFQTEAVDIEAAGGRITRVILDHEIKRDYQRFQHRRGAQSRSAARDGDTQTTTPEGSRAPATDQAVESRDRRADDASAAAREFADQVGLPTREGHLEIPDPRIEFEDAHGRRQHRDLELVTPNYSRSQLAGKSASGFTAYRAVGSRAAGPGSEPYDPHRLERVR